MNILLNKISSLIFNFYFEARVGEQFLLIKNFDFNFISWELIFKPVKRIVKILFIDYLRDFFYYLVVINNFSDLFSFY